MKKFDFRFSAVEQQRAAMLDLRTAELADVSRKSELAFALLNTRREALAEVVAARPTRAVPLDPRREAVRQRYVHALRQEIGRRVQQMARIEEELEVARLAVAAAHREVKALEVLRDRDEAVWRSEARRAEGKETDEHNSRRHGR